MIWIYTGGGVARVTDVHTGWNEPGVQLIRNAMRALFISPSQLKNAIAAANKFRPLP